MRLPLPLPLTSAGHAMLIAQPPSPRTDGLHHDSSKAASKTSEAQAAKAKIVTTKVLDLLDKDGDRVVTLSEFLALGSEGLPDFKGFEDLGHHYGAWRSLQWDEGFS